MEKITKLLFFTTLLSSIKMDDYDDYDVQLELKSVLAKVTSLSIDVQRLQWKQRALQKRLSNVHTDGNGECCKEISKSIEHKIQDIQETYKESKTENYFAIKKAFSSEKKHLRSMIRTWEQIVEAKDFHQKKTDGQSVEIEEIEEKISQQAIITSNLSIQLDLIKETIEVVTNLNEERIETMEEKFGTIETQSDGIEKRIDSISSSISSLILASDRKVSFSVQYKPQDGSVATKYKKETAIKFKTVIYNEGEGYNETTGIFTVPVAGVYQFIFFVEGWHNGDTFTCQAAVIGLYIDGKLRAAAVADPRHDKQFASSGNTYINYFSKGQRVQIGTTKACEQHIIFGYRTTFSGHLLY